MIVKLGGTVKALVDMDCDLQDDEIGIIKCADKGDLLTVHEINRGGWLLVSRQHQNANKFGCRLDEVCES